jgi:hypothetical protein
MSTAREEAGFCNHGVDREGCVPCLKQSLVTIARRAVHLLAPPKDWWSSARKAAYVKEMEARLLGKDAP